MTITVESLGLNRDNIEFAIPPKCDCGCNEYGSLCIKDKDDLVGFMCSMLDEFCCEKSMGVAFDKNGEVTIAVKEIESIFASTTSDCISNLSSLVKDLEICHMVILNEVDNDKDGLLYDLIF